MIPLHTAQALARQVRDLLAPACAELMVVGGVRRQKAQVHDIEFALRSKPAAPIFGEVRSARPALDALLARLLHTGELRLPEPSRRVDGPRQKRLLIPQAGGVELELWIAPSADSFGNTVAIRTGDYEFSKMLVTQRRDGGLLPNGWMHEDGHLWPFRLAGDERARFKAKAAPERPIPCRTEDDFFRHLGIFDVPDPSMRDLKMAERLRGRLAGGVGR